MARVRKNMYTLSFGRSVGVIMDEELMKKMAKIQYQTQEKILELLENNEEHHYDYGWSISEKPKHLPQEERICRYIQPKDQFSTMEWRIKDMFDITKVENLYDVRPFNYNEATEEAERQHTKHLINTEVEE